MGEWGHTIVQIIGVAVPVILYIATNRYYAKRDNDRRHAENTARLEEIISERKYLVPHDHIEEDGELHASGIIRKTPNGR